MESPKLNKNLLERNDRELKASEEVEQTFTDLCHYLEFCILLHDLEGRILDCNAMICRELGYSEEVLLLMNMSET